MTNLHRALFSVTTVGVALASSITHAQVTAEEVWTAWSDLASTAGYTVDVGDTASAGGQLTLSNVTFSLSEGTTQLTASLEEMQLTEQGDGTVVVTYSDRYDAVIRDSSIDGTVVEIPMVIDVSNTTTTVSGTPDAMRNDVAADAITVAIETTLPDDEDVDFVARIAMSNVAGVVQLNGDEVDQDLTASQMTLAARFSDPDNADEFADIAATLNNLTSTASGSISAMAAFSGLPDLLKGGSSADSAFTYSDAKYSVRGQGEGEEFALEAMLGAGSVSAAVSGTGITYAVEGNDLDATISSSDMPVGTAGFSADKAAWNVSLPLDEEQSAEQFGLTVDLANVEVSDEIWAQMDPFGAFPRDALSVKLDVVLGGDLVTTALNQGLSGEELADVAGQEGTLDIRNLNVSFGDLSLSANGNLSSDGGNPAAMSLPTGTISLELIGANGFLDQLEGKGPFNGGQLAAVRGMLGFFGRPGSGPDTLVSEIELSPQGIMANGVPLPFSP